MKQYRYSSADFVTPGESGDPDAIMDDNDLRELRRLAGLNEDLGGPEADNVAKIPNEQGTNPMSPVGANPSTKANEKRKKEKELGIRVGDDAWFKLWFGDKR